MGIIHGCVVRVPYLCQLLRGAEEGSFILLLLLMVTYFGISGDLVSARRVAVQYSHLLCAQRAGFQTYALMCTRRAGVQMFVLLCERRYGSPPSLKCSRNVQAFIF